MTGTDVDLSEGSEVTKTSMAFVNMFKKKYKEKKSVKWIIENEEDFLISKKFEVKEIEVKTSNAVKRKSFEELKHRDSKIRTTARRR